MRRILVVDDEAIQRRVLGKIIRNAVPAYEVLEAGNGKAALDLVRETAIDIVLTDIRMPMMDGLQFIENLQQLRQGVKIVILTGYRYFEYAQKAIQLGASDFLLKPVREETIAETIKRMDMTLKQERETWQQVSAYYGQMLHDWVVFGIQDQRQEIIAKFSLQHRGMVFVTELLPYATIPDRMQEELRSNVSRRLNEFMEPHGSAVSFMSKENNAHIVTLITYREHSPVDELFMRLAGELAAEFGHEAAVFLGIGNEKPVAESVRQSYLEALEAVTFRYYLQGKALTFRHAADRTCGFAYNAAKEEELIKEAIRKTRDEELAGLAEELFAGALSKGFPPVEQWKNTLVRIMVNVSYAVKDFMPEAEYVSTVSVLEERLRRCSDNAEAKNRFTEALLMFSSTIRGHRSKKHETVIEKFAAFMDGAYMQDLSLETVARQLYFSPNYLSAMIKNQTGMTFSKYLSDVRLKKAVKLLEETELKVYEIAARAGFRDEKYFYRVFKGKFGLTPDEYRRERAQ
ncbi:response regulator [Paenibacillus hamazuiensis]|uniref:response regulator n=1 Tax=Paenibacillus hamazuiensis TaxID=2936508 RepID=UPI00200E962E|nr:response regulator [Paenibacillus hamazuiensis]